MGKKISKNNPWKNFNLKHGPKDERGLPDRKCSPFGSRKKRNKQIKSDTYASIYEYYSRVEKE